MNLEHAPVRIRRYWRVFDPDGSQAARFYEPFRVGFTDDHADAGALRILDGSKTATSSLLWEYETSGRDLPFPGALSVLLDGLHEPVCIVESTQVDILPFEAIGQPFCADYAESDGTIEGWRALNWPIYQAQCRDLGRSASMDMPLVCETFRVIHPADPASLARCKDAIQTRHGAHHAP